MDFGARCETEAAANSMPRKMDICFEKLHLHETMSAMEMRRKVEAGPCLAVAKTNETDMKYFNTMVMESLGTE